MSAQSMRRVPVVRDRPPLPVQQAHMDMNAIADDIGCYRRREAEVMPQGPSCRPCDLTYNYGAIGGGDAERRRASDFVLSGSVLRQIRLGLDARRAQRCHQDLAEDAMSSHSIEVVGRTEALLGAFVVEFLFEGAQQAKTGVALQIVERLLKERAWAAIPWLTVRLQHVAEKEMFARVLFAEVDMNLGGRVRLQHEIPERS